MLPHAHARMHERISFCAIIITTTTITTTTTLLSSDYDTHLHVLSGRLLLLSLTTISRYRSFPAVERMGFVWEKLGMENLGFFLAFLEVNTLGTL